MRNILKPRERFIRLREDDGFSDGQFIRPPTPIPWKSIALAVFLFIGGSVLIIVGALIKIGCITQQEWLDKGIPFLVLGSLMFVPGAYHVYIAYYAWYEYPGYDFSMIPDMD